jgi:hypothetical protein
MRRSWLWLLYVFGRTAGLTESCNHPDQELAERLAPACHEKSLLTIRESRGHPRGYPVPSSPIDELPRFCKPALDIGTRSCAGG